MWLSFLLACCVCALILMVPGGLLLGACHFPWVEALVGAPAISVAVISLCCIILGTLGLPTTVLTVLVIPSALILAVWLVPHVRRMGKGRACAPDGPSWRIVCLYLVLACGTGALFFVRRLGSPDAIMQEWDLVSHINSVHAMAESGMLTPLASGSYLTTADASLDVMSSGATGFYPSGWYVVCALDSMMTGVGTAVVINAVNAAFAFVVYPLSLLWLLHVVFPGDRRTVWCGALACVSLVIFPWGLLVYGPIYPNLAGFCVMPAGAALFISAFAPGRTLGERAGRAALFVLLLVGEALLHPNTLFSLGLFLIPWVLHQIGGHESYKVGSMHVSRVVVMLLFMLLCGVLWLAAYHLPMLQATVSFTWPTFTFPAQAVVNIAALSYVSGFSPVSAQLIPAVLLVVGVRALWQARDSRWLIGSYLIACLLMVVASSIEGYWRALLTGFWYTDPYRVAAMTSLFAAPILAVGYRRACDVLGMAIGRGSLRRVRERTRAVICGACAVMLVFFPSFVIPGVARIEMAFSTYRGMVEAEYHHTAPLSGGERRFLGEVSGIVGDDVVINNPYDGSAYAYGDDGIRCYYRYLQGYGQEGETPQSALIRTNLVNLATDEQVQSAVRQTGARYLLVMDADDIGGTFLDGPYHADQWEGIMSVGDSTPGFELVLRRGRLRLYRIDDLVGTA